MQTRRAHLKQMAATLAGCTVLPSASWGQDPAAWPIAIFEKVFEGLTYEELADAVAETGADGIEATIRPRGHIEPAVADQEVPKMVAALRKRGRRVVIAATAIDSVDTPHAESLLKTFKTSGITHYRTGYYRYDHTRPMMGQLQEFTAKARDLAALNREIGIQGLYQTHAGARYLGALAWDLAYLLQGIDADALGAAIDLRHIRADTGTSWKTAAAALQPHIRSIYLKDAVWVGARSDELQDVPLDTGFVSESMFDFVRDGLPPMPLCIHMEHMGYRVFEKHEIPAAIEAHRKDIAALRRWLKA